MRITLLAFIAAKEERAIRVAFASHAVGTDRFATFTKQDTRQNGSKAAKSSRMKPGKPKFATSATRKNLSLNSHIIANQLGADERNALLAKVVAREHGMQRKKDRRTERACATRRWQRNA
jgi:hypothetical protein